MSDTNEPSPRPWRFEFRPPRMEKPHSDHEKAHFVDANGRDVWLSRKNAALIVDAVNERELLRDIVRRFADLSESLLANYEYRYREDVNSMAFVENTRGFLREARAAIGEDAP